MSQAISTSRMTWIYLRLRTRRLINFGVSSFSRKKKNAKRSATAGKAKSGFLALFATIYVIGLMVSIGWSSSSSLKTLFPDPTLFATVFAYKFTFQIFFLSLMNLGSRELARSDSDIEWLSALPAPWPVLLLGKVLERAFLNLWFLILLATLIGSKIQGGMGLIPAALASTLLILPLMLTAGLLQVLVEYFLKLNLAPNKLRNTQATIALVAIAPIILTLTPSLGADALWGKIANYMPAITLETAPALASRFGIDTTLGAGSIASFIVQFIIVAALAMWGLAAILKRGAVSASTRESSRKRVIRKNNDDSLLIRLLSPVIRRELTLLARDRTYLTQTLGMPILMLAVQMYPMFNREFNPESSALLPTMVFFSLSYMLAFSSFQAINSEGQALWIVYGVPKSFEGIIKEKLNFWMIVTTIVSLVGLTLLHVVFHVPLTSKQIFYDFAIVFGVFLYGWIAISLGVFGSNPLSEDIQKRVKPSSMMYYLGLISLFIPVFHVQSYWTAAVLVVLIATLSYSFWQEARDYLPYLLDPVSAPPSQVSLAHGSITTVFFFLLQILIAVILSSFELPPALILLLSFAGAGLIAFLSIELFFWRKKTIGVPKFFGPDLSKSLAIGAASGIGLSLFAFAYLKLNNHWKWIEVPESIGGNSLIYGLIPVAILAAPFCEEFIFRGLVFKGLERNFPTKLAIIGSAMIFAVVHPPLSFVPVFALGLVTAFLYSKTKNLSASIAAHAVYNLIVVSVQLYLPQLLK
jgi:ABC-2 type transport system permease protein